MLKVHMGRPTAQAPTSRLRFERALHQPGGPMHLPRKIAVSLALSGDPQMLALCINKLLSSPKPVDRTVRIEDFTGNLTERGEQVITALTEGQITPTEGSTLLSALATQAKLVELDGLVKRIDVLEDAVTS